jgi:uncharacterized protein (DUF1684 family)
MKDAAAVKNRLEMLCQKDSPHSVHTVRNRADDSTDSVSFDFKRSESPPNALESSFKILNSLSPPTYPPPQVKIAVEAGTSRNENTKLPVMQ